MKQKVHRIGALLVVLMLNIVAFAGCGNMAKESDVSMDVTTEAATTTDETTKEQSEMKKYIAIGDSLTFGFGLANKKTERFSAKLTDKLNKKDAMYVEYNYGVNGLTSDGLLDMLKAGEIGMLSEAALITIDIGANDVLDSLNQILIPMFEGGSVSKNEYEAAMESYNDSIISAYDNTKEILEHIKSVNPDCTIVIATIYNPYRNLDVELILDDRTVTLAQFADELMQELNNNIKKLANDYDCHIADWYTAFEMTKLNVLDAKYDETGINLDIHPNKEGHNLMATVMYEAVN